MANSVFGLIEVTLTDSGVAVSSSRRPCSKVVLIAPAANSGVVTIGDSASNCSFPILETRGVELPIHELSLLYAKSTNAGDKLEVLWFRNR